MSDELVCIATLDKVPEAHLCKSQLEAAGIRAVLENEFTVNANWLWNNALGGIRLYVAPENRDAAMEILAQARHLFHLDKAEADGVAAEQTDRQFQPGKDLPAGSADDDDDEPLQSEREDHAKRALIFAVVGMFIFPLQIFTVWILWEVATMPGPLRPLYRFYCVGAGLVAVPYLAVLAALAFAIVLGML